MKIKFISAVSIIIFNVVVISNSLKAQQIYDTLIIRDVCFYCDNVHGDKTKCFCSGDCDKTVFWQFEQQYGNGITYLMIENPSKSLYRLDFSKFSNLKKVYMYGNDSDILIALHPEMMKIKTLKNIELSNISVPELEVERLKKQASNVEISGLDGIAINPDGRDTAFDLVLILRKEGKLALWIYPYNAEPQYVYDDIQSLGYGKYIGYAESGCEFINRRLNTREKYTLNQGVWYSYPQVSDPQDRYIVNRNGSTHYEKIKYFELTGTFDVDGNFATTEKKEKSDSLAVIFGGYLGLLSPDFKVIIPAVYTNIHFPAKVHYRELANVVPDSIREFINWVDCSELYSPTNHAKMNVQELILVDSGDYKGAYNFDGDLMIPMIYHDIIPLVEGGATRYYCFKDNRKGVVFDQKGAIIENIVLAKKSRLQQPPKSNEFSLAERPYVSKNMNELIALLQKIIENKGVCLYDDIAGTHAATRAPENITTIYVTGLTVPETGDQQTVVSLSLIDANKGIKGVVRFNDLLVLGYKNPELMKQLMGVLK